MVLIESNRVDEFVYRPGGRAEGGGALDFMLRFPEGATWLEQDGQALIEFTEVTASFGAGSALQLQSPLSKVGGTMKQLTMGPLAWEQLADVFDLDASAGLDMMLYEKVPVVWRGGVIESGGIRAPRFSLGSLTSLPLPEVSAEYSDFRLDVLFPFGCSGCFSPSVSWGDSFAGRIIYASSVALELGQSLMVID
jgi:hypothetical protein